jgi:hypothetical protein
MECSCCFDEITVETGKTVLGCGHNFHFRCLASWFLQQESAGNAQNCPLCRREASDIEKLPALQGDADEDDDSEYEDEDEDVDELVYTRQQLHDLLLSRGAIGVTDVMWTAWADEENVDRLAFDLEDINHTLMLQNGRELTEEEFDQLFLAQGVPQGAPQIPRATPEDLERARAAAHAAIAALRAEQAPDAPPLPAVPVNLRVFAWTRVGEGRWERRVHNPEDVQDDEPLTWDGNVTAQQPPDSLALQTREAATKIQALFRGVAARRQIRQEATREAARKIQALFRGHKVRQIINPARALLAMR